MTVAVSLITSIVCLPHRRVIEVAESAASIGLLHKDHGITEQGMMTAKTSSPSIFSLEVYLGEVF